MLTHTITDVCARVLAEAGARGLEVNRFLDLGQVTTGKIGGTTKEVWEDRGDGRENNLREFARRLRSIRRFVCGERLFPVKWKFSSNTTSEFCVLG
jgi:hypothetical protein